jgi:hypothetical protein
VENSVEDFRRLSLPDRKTWKTYHLLHKKFLKKKNFPRRSQPGLAFPITRDHPIFGSRRSPSVCFVPIRKNPRCSENAYNLLIPKDGEFVIHIAKPNRSPF